MIVRDGKYSVADNNIVIKDNQKIVLYFYVNCKHRFYIAALNIIFVRDGILSVADYNSTRVGVVVVVVVVYLFCNGIT